MAGCPGCGDAHPGSGGPSRVVPSRRVRDTEPLGGSAVTPCQRPGAVWAQSGGKAPSYRNSGRGSENSAQRGSRGASQNTARGTSKVRRTCGFKTNERRSLAGSPFRFGVARCRGPWVRCTCGVPRALGPCPSARFARRAPGAIGPGGGALAKAAAMIVGRRRPRHTAGRTFRFAST